MLLVFYIEILDLGHHFDYFHPSLWPIRLLNTCLLMDWLIVNNAEKAFQQIELLMFKLTKNVIFY